MGGTLARPAKQIQSLIGRVGSASPQPQRVDPIQRHASCSGNMFFGELFFGADIYQGKRRVTLEQL